MGYTLVSHMENSTTGQEDEELKKIRGLLFPAIGIQVITEFNLYPTKENSKENSQDEDKQKSPQKRNRFCKYGSCDSYIYVGDGSYSDESLIKGFQKNSKSICSVLKYIMPNLEKQGVMNVIFEGVQLNPGIIKKYLINNRESRK